MKILEIAPVTAALAPGAAPDISEMATLQLRRPQAKPSEDVIIVLRALAARRGGRA